VVPYGTSIGYLALMIINPSAILSTNKHHEKEHLNFLSLKSGREGGLVYFYNRMFRGLYWRAMRMTKCDVTSDCIVQEAFLRLWQIRNQLRDAAHVEIFVKEQTRQEALGYFRKSANRFHRNLIRLDGIDDYQEFISADRAEDEEHDIFSEGQNDQQQTEQWKHIQEVLPSLSERQQLFISLCLKYSFSYDRIAWHLGGISDYQVARHVEKTLESLRSVITNTKKLDQAGKTRCMKYEGDLNSGQAEILRMRYELQYSFEEIAQALNLSRGQVQKTFLAAHLELRKSSVK
jgi:RNA polymerase sigma factor (sigma-70 family)